MDLPDIHLSQLKYVALSYVWGGPQRITLQASNYADLHTPGSLTGRLAKTIDDDLTLAEALGVRYVWVDALCIIQDSEEDKAAQLSGMGKVYANSLFTIVAASGADSEAGIPGISAPRTAVQHEVLLPQQPPLSLLSTLNPGSRPFENGTKQHGLAVARLDPAGARADPPRAHRAEGTDALVLRQVVLVRGDVLRGARRARQLVHAARLGALFDNGVTQLVHARRRERAGLAQATAAGRGLHGQAADGGGRCA